MAGGGGVTNLDELLKSMSPELQSEDYAFCTVQGDLKDFLHLDILCTFCEKEGLTLILPATEADAAKLPYQGRFRQITLTVHSSLDAVGLTAAVATKLTSYGISANVVAAYYHDHIFVPASKAEAALAALQEFRNLTK